MGTLYYGLDVWIGAIFLDDTDEYRFFSCIPSMNYRVAGFQWFMAKLIDGAGLGW
jgi:hypothetical protein